MAHFAELDENNVVIRVVVVDNSQILDSEGNESEAIGISFLRNFYNNNANWKKTSYNGNIRKNFAGIGLTYDESLDAFVWPQPFSSWILNNETVNWEAPITMPTLTADEEAAGKYYSWDESAYQADNTTGWILNTPG
mgnify:CR=1 FL=1|tara:strand:- start:140 stop:550 length:411 start_codon:yes stop_codon:yes gene_type:complete